MKNILIIGATSSIAEKCARIWASEKNNLYLTGRNEKKLNELETSLKIYENQIVMSQIVDLNKINNYSILVNEIIKKFKKIFIVLIAHGSLGNQKEAELNIGKMMDEVNINAISTISLLSLLAGILKNRKKVLLSNFVCGWEKGRAKNYHGSSKQWLLLFFLV